MKLKKWILPLMAMLCCVTTAFTACGGVQLGDSSFSSSHGASSSTGGESMSSENSSTNGSVEESSPESTEDSTQSSADSSTDSSTEDATDFPTVNATELVDVAVDVPVGRDPVILMLSDTQIIDASQQRKDDRLNGAGSVLNKRWSRGNMEDRLFRYIREAVNRSKPDLILLVGDNVYGEFDDNGYALEAFVQFMESFQIPWAPVLGNHDSETKKGIDWLCAQYENAEHCLFKRGSLTGNGNYSIGITQGGKLLRTIFMVDSVSNRDGSKRDAYGFAQNEIAWYTNEMQEIKRASAPTGISVMTHVPMQAFLDYLVNKYSYTNAETLNLDVNGRDGDFGIANEAMGGVWDANYTVWNGLKTLGVDSMFVGHVHGTSVGFTLDGVRVQFGLKTGTYDALNYTDGNGNYYWNYGDMGDPITGATVIPVSKTDGSVNPYHIQTQLEEDKTFNETLTPLERDENVTNVFIKRVDAFSGSEAHMLYVKFYDANNAVRFLEVPTDVSSKSNVALENFAKQIVFTGTDTLANVGYMMPQSGNAFVLFQLNGEKNFNRFQYLFIPVGTTYECDTDGNGKIDTIWTFSKDFKIVYDPASCRERAGFGGCEGNCSAGKWHIFTDVSTRFAQEYEITGGHRYYSPTNTQVIFKFTNSTDSVNLGYTAWMDNEDTACKAFKKFIKINGKALPATAEVVGLDQVDGLALRGISLSNGDVVTIEKGAIFIHGNVKMTLNVSLSYTWNSTTSSYTVSVTQ